MTRHSPVRLLASCVFVVLLSSCAGGDTSVDPAAAASAQGQGGTPRSPQPTTSSADGPAGDGSQGGNPGGPGGSRDEAGTGGTDFEAGGNPGAPGDVAVFEEAGVPHSVLRDDAATKCVNGVCTLLEPVATVGNPDDVGGLDECIIDKQSDIHYTPPAKDGLFQKGAKVQADVDCTADGSNTDGTDGTNGTSNGTDGSDTSGSPTSASSSAAAESQG
jgi:hypothetical protein